MGKVLVDADVLVAITKLDDSNHKKALFIENILKRREVVFYFSPFTIAETVTVLSHKVSQQAARQFLTEVRSFDIESIELTHSHRFLVDEWFKKQNKKGTSYFDCYNMALMDSNKNQLTSIFSFDEVYKRNGFTLAQDLVTS